MKRTYQPKKRARSKVHGFRARMKTQGGRRVLKSRRDKGRKKLSAQYPTDFVWQDAEVTNIEAKYRLKKNKQYAYVYKKGSSVSDNNITLLYCSVRSDPSRFGFSISKKFGNAVRRNRKRRQLKECASILAPRVRRNFSIVIIPRHNVTDDFLLLLKSMEQLLASADLLTEQQGV